MKAQKQWETLDANKSGTLTKAEVLTLLNSQELQDAYRILTNIEPVNYKEVDIAEIYKRADADKSGELSRAEFLAMYLALCVQRFKSNPVLVVEALLGFIDVDRNGIIEGKELKVLAGIVGVPPPLLLLPMSDSLHVNYREVLRTMYAMSGQKQA